MATQDDLKREAAEHAADLVKDGMVVGLGTGSTAAFFIASLITRRLRIVCIPTSERSAQQARDGGLVLTDFAHHSSIDICVDGADEIQLHSLDLVKGLGGALLREKLVASAADRLVIVADTAKLVENLGTRAPIPVEVTRFAWELTQARLASHARQVQLRSMADGMPYLTDGGNYIIDCSFDGVTDALALDTQLRAIVGVVETGLFIGMAQDAFVAGADGIAHYTRQ